MGKMSGWKMKNHENGCDLKARLFTNRTTALFDFYFIENRANKAREKVAAKKLEPVKMKMELMEAP